MDTEPVTIERDGGVLLIGIDDDKANALTLEVIGAVNDHLDEVTETAGALVIHGRPGFLCAGFHLATMREGGEARAELLGAGLGLLLRLFELDRPVVIACTGHALAVGAGLLCVGDVRIGGDGAYQLGFNEVAVGVGLGEPIAEIARYRMSPTHLDGIVRGEVTSPHGAIAAGLLDTVVADGQVLAESRATALRLAELAPAAYRRAKAAVRGPVAATIRGALEREYPKLTGATGDH